ncbi:rod shape-determining protein MreD [Macromonas nakdongensis]|uniref:rod shape-determining protein MreD n=1 Tax=Macromonas nakdongensis TaxID=1843082 RepID=UPI000C3206C4|nr:rod shape-determining protein MreD [Macromonas nakdongensis]
MIMRRGQALLLPANPWFVWGSLFVALFLGIWLDVAVAGRAPWLPDLLALALVFWSVHQPQRVGVGAAFVLGLLVDVHHGALLGQHALAYTALGYLAVVLHRRLLWFDLPTQALHVLPLFLASHALQLTTRLIAGDGWPGWSLGLAPLLETLLWPLATLLLLAPQRRAHDPDENRPI